MASLRALQQSSVPELDFLRLHYQADLRLLTARWLRPVSAAEFRQGYTATLAAAEAARCPFWLIDLRGRSAPSPDDARWLTTEFLPLLPARLGGAVYVGMLFPSHYTAPSGPPHPATATAIVPAPHLIVRSFSEEATLVEWLVNCQRSAPRHRMGPGTTPPPWPYWYGA